MDKQQEIKFIIRPGFFGKRTQNLIINPDYIQFEENDFSNSVIRFDKNDISEHRYGIKWISGYKFTIGRTYMIFIRSASGKDLKINLKSLYGIRKKENHKLFNDILKALWDFYFGRVTGVNYYKFCKGEDVVIENVKLTRDAVIVNNGGMIKQNKTIIPWTDLAIKEYRTYIAIYSSTDASKMNSTFSYLNDWNTSVLYTIIKKILDEKAYLTFSN